MMFRFAAGAALAVVLALGAMPSAAAAHAVTHPTLNGEALSASASLDSPNGPPWPFVLGACGNAVSYGPNFRFYGTAIGPYPGSFSETGTVSYNVNDYSNTWGQGPVTSFSGAFTITSPTGSVTVSGTATLVHSGAPLAVCFGGAGGGGITIGQILTKYKATITTPTGTYRDHGTSYVTLYQSIALGE